MNPAVVQSDYEKKIVEQGLQKRKQEIIDKVAMIEGKVQTTDYLTALRLMDIVQEVIAACGGEPKIQYLDVAHNFVKVFTRVPMDANLYQFMPEAEDNPRFHKVVTKILLLCPRIEGVKWLPSSNGERGSYLMVSIKQ